MIFNTIFHLGEKEHKEKNVYIITMFSNFWNKEDSLAERREFDPVYIREAEEYRQEQEKRKKEKGEKERVERERVKRELDEKYTVILTFKNKSIKNNSIKRYFTEL